jgi:hypothetical protein
MSAHAAKTDRFVLFWQRVRKFFGVTSDRIYILPTWYCLVFNLLLLVLFIASFPLRNPSLLVLVFAMVFIQLLSMVETHVNLREIEIEPSGDNLLETGQESEIVIQTRSRESSFGLNFRFLEGDLAKDLADGLVHRRVLRKLILSEFVYALFKSFRSESIKASDFVTVSRDAKFIRLPILSETRGYYRVPPIIVTSFFPFGLFRAVKIVSLDSHYTAYPTPRQSKRKTESFDQVAKDMRHAGSGDRLNGGDDYNHHREFLAGDPLRRIDWKASSRRGLKIVKVFDSSGFVRGNVLRWCDTTADDDEGKLSELAFSVLKSTHEGVFFALELPQQKTRISSGENHKRECLKLLATFRR